MYDAGRFVPGDTIAAGGMHPPPHTPLPRRRMAEAARCGVGVMTCRTLRCVCGAGVRLPYLSLCSVLRGAQLQLWSCWSLQGCSRPRSARHTCKQPLPCRSCAAAPRADIGKCKNMAAWEAAVASAVVSGSKGRNVRMEVAALVPFKEVDRNEPNRIPNGARFALARAIQGG